MFRRQRRRRRRPVAGARRRHGSPADRERSYFDWAYICPSREDYRQGLFDVIDDCVAENEDVRLDDIGFPRAEYCRCGVCEQAFDASEYDDRMAWRASVITDFVAEAADRIPGTVYMTLYPDPYPGHLYERAGIDLEVIEEYVDEFVVPLYDTAYGTTYWLETIAKGFESALETPFNIELYAVNVDVDNLIHALEVAEEYAEGVFFGYEASNGRAALRRMQADQRDGVTHGDPGTESDPDGDVPRRGSVRRPLEAIVSGYYAPVAGLVTDYSGPMRGIASPTFRSGVGRLRAIGPADRLQPTTPFICVSVACSRDRGSALIVDPQVMTMREQQSQQPTDTNAERMAESTMNQSQQAMEQLLDLQRNAARMTLSALQWQETAQQQGLEMTKSMLESVPGPQFTESMMESYLQGMEAVMPEMEQVMEQGMQAAAQPQMEQMEQMGSQMQGMGSPSGIAEQAGHQQGPQSQPQTRLQPQPQASGQQRPRPQTEQGPSGRPQPQQPQQRPQPQQSGQFPQTGEWVTPQEYGGESTGAAGPQQRPMAAAPTRSSDVGTGQFGGQSQGGEPDRPHRGAEAGRGSGRDQFEGERQPQPHGSQPQPEAQQGTGQPHSGARTQRGREHEQPDQVSSRPRDGPTRDVCETSTHSESTPTNAREGSKADTDAAADRPRAIDPGRSRERKPATTGTAMKGPALTSGGPVRSRTYRRSNPSGGPKRTAVTKSEARISSEPRARRFPVPNRYSRGVTPTRTAEPLGSMVSTRKRNRIAVATPDSRERKKRGYRVSSPIEPSSSSSPMS